MCADKNNDNIQKQDETEIELVVYKKIVPGDFRKFVAESNNTPSGGGARDLRFSPADKFFPIFQRMFEEDNNILKGDVNWLDGSVTKFEIHSPTTSRPNEVRIGRVHECIPESIVDSIIDQNDCILVMVLDIDKNVSAFFTSKKELQKEGWDETVKYAIIKSLAAKRGANTTSMGYIDFINKEVYTNGRE